MQDITTLSIPTSLNQPAIDLWNGLLFDKFQRFEWVLTRGLSAHGDAMLERTELGELHGARLLDVGCGFGDLSEQLAQVVGPDGQVVALDAAQRFVDASARRLAHLRQGHTRCADAECDDLGGPYDAIFSRFGTMFFARPLQALRNFHAALRPGGQLNFVVWRKREANEWLYAPQCCVEAFIDPEALPKDAATCGPGPFSMASADLVGDLLMAAGFIDLRFERVDADLCIGRDLDEALAFALELGPAGERMRIAESSQGVPRSEIERALKKLLAPHQRESGIWMRSSTWVVRASKR